MLNQAGKNIFAVMQELPLTAGVSEVFEGMALIADNSGAEQSAKPSMGAHDEQFLGVALVNALKVVDLPLCEKLVAVLQPPAGPNTQVTLSKSPVPLLPAGQEVTGYVGTDPSAAGVQVTFTLLAGTTYQVDTAGPVPVPPGSIVTVNYVYAPTLAEVLAVHSASRLAGPRGRDRRGGQAAVGGDTVG